MRHSGSIVAAATAGLVAGCGLQSSASPESSMRSQVSVACKVSGLPQEQGLCMTWKLFQGDGAGWVLVTSRDTPICGPIGDTILLDEAACEVGKRFLVEYAVTATVDGTVQGSDGWGFSALSGGGASDVCASGSDKASLAVVQFATVFRQKGHSCGSDMLSKGTWDGSGVWQSVLWVEAPDCVVGGPPGSFCHVFDGNVQTEQTGLSGDDGSRYAFNAVDSSSDANQVYYLVFDPTVATGVLQLLNQPWLVGHDSTGQEEDLGAEGAQSYRLDDSADGPRHVGFLRDDSQTAGCTEVVWHNDADCDRPLGKDRLHRQSFANPPCKDGSASQRLQLEGTGGSRFDVTFLCGDGATHAVPCDAKLMPNGLVCDASHAS
ncbi:MAG TPA: hypothetical protein VMT17_10600 [Anaeromyxobacteraceae bacterium]|nr:hypothetical protein [Anaeromyxobacteraceae bacterium]